MHDDPDPHPVYRAPMRSRSIEAGAFAGATFGLDRGVVGIGEPLERRPADLGEALLMVVDAHGYKAGRMLARFAELPEGEFVWTRTSDDEYWLGRIRGPWRYDDSEEATEVGICQTRPAEWSREPLGFLAVPAAVSVTFSRGGKNLQRINDEECELLTRDLWKVGT